MLHENSSLGTDLLLESLLVHLESKQLIGHQNNSYLQGEL